MTVAYTLGGVEEWYESDKSSRLAELERALRVRSRRR